MEVDAEKTEKALVLKLIGRLDAQSADHCKEQLQSKLEGNELSPVLDFSGVQYVSSMGLRVIITIGQDLQQKGIKLLLVCPQGPVLEILKTAGFNLIFSVFESKEEALKTL